jgi:hypothetical protein
MQQKSKAAVIGSVLLSAVLAVGIVSHPKSSGIISLAAPDKAGVGELVVLDATQSTATSFKWMIYPQTPNFLVIDGGKRAIFSEGHPGVYNIYLSGANGGEVDSIVQSITVGNSPTPSPTPTPQPVDIGTMVKGWVTLVTDPNVKTESAALGSSFKSVAAQIRAGVLTTPDVIIKSTAVANNDALGNSASAWKPFFEKLQAELKSRSAAGTLTTPEQHALLWDAIGNGLLDASK